MNQAEAELKRRICVGEGEFVTEEELLQYKLDNLRAVKVDLIMMLMECLEWLENRRDRNETDVLLATKIRDTIKKEE